jgi:hypothetical protein
VGDVDGVRLDRRHHVVAREPLARVNENDVIHAEAARPADDDVEVLARLIEVHR